MASATVTSATPVKITVVGTGYVGISNAVLLAQHNAVVALDIDARKVEQINAKQSPIADPEIEDYLATIGRSYTRELRQNLSALSPDLAASLP